MSDYTEVAFLNAFFRNTAYTPAATVYLAMFTTATTDAGGGTEVSDSAYARQATTFAAPASPGGTMANSATVTYPAIADSQITVTDWAIYDAATAGNQLAHGTLSAPKTLAVTDILSFTTGQIVITAA